VRRPRWRISLARPSPASSSAAATAEESIRAAAAAAYAGKSGRVTRTALAQQRVEPPVIGGSPFVFGYLERVELELAGASRRNLTSPLTHGVAGREGESGQGGTWRASAAHLVRSAVVCVWDPRAENETWLDVGNGSLLTDIGHRGFVSIPLPPILYPVRRGVQQSQPVDCGQRVSGHAVGVHKLRS
jgi:hypothetical protein